MRATGATSTPYTRCRSSWPSSPRRVQQTYSQYGDLAALREPLKNSFRLTLTLVLLLAMLAAIYGAIYSAQRLIRPVQDLIAGTRAVGKGDFAPACRCPRAMNWATWSIPSTT